MSSWRLVLAWETGGPTGDAEDVPQEFVPTDPEDIRIYAMPSDDERARALDQRLYRVRSARGSHGVVHTFQIPYSEVVLGYVTVYGRSYEEARLLGEHYHYHDMEQTDSDSFELDVQGLELV